MQEAAVELRAAVHAEQLHRHGQLGLEDLDEADDALLARRAEREGEQPPDADQPRAHRNGLQHVRAAHEAAVDDDLGLAANRRDHLGEQVDRAAAVVELPAAVIRHVDHVDAVLEREARVLARADALHDQRHADGALQLLHELPVRLRAVRLALAGLAERPYGDRLAPVDAALAAPEVRHVDGEADGDGSGVDAALREIDDPALVTVRV